jgi:hypothetical protein
LTLFNATSLAYTLKQRLAYKDGTWLREPFGTDLGADLHQNHAIDVELPPKGINVELYADSR